MPACHIDDAGRSCLAFLNDPKLLDRRPSSPSLRTRQNRNLAHVCSFACKSISKLSQPRFSTGRRPSPEDYLLPTGVRFWLATGRPIPKPDHQISKRRPTNEKTGRRKTATLRIFTASMTLSFVVRADKNDLTALPTVFAIFQTAIKTSAHAA
jgi:hypothetical protein